MNKKNQSDTNNMLKIYGLGRFIVKYADKEKRIEDWSSDKALKMFKYFILHREKEVYNDELVEVFWPEVDPNTGKKRLYNTIYLLRKNLGIKDIVINKTTSYKFNQDYHCWVDWEKFLDIYNNKDDDVTIKTLKEAVELYKGDLFPGLRYEDWVEDIRTNIKEKYLDILYKLSEELYRENKYSESIMYLNKGMKEDIYREDYYELMMKNYAKMGRIYEAISIYENYRKLIKDELGIEPGPSVTKTYKKIRNNDLVQQHIPTETNSNGALLCDLDAFDQIYELEKRQITRSDKSFTLLTIDFSELNIKEKGIEDIYKEIASLFRTGDVVSFNNNSMKILLHDMNLENANVVLDKIFKFLKDKNIGKLPEFDFKEVSEKK